MENIVDILCTLLVSILSNLGGCYCSTQILVATKVGIMKSSQFFFNASVFNFTQSHFIPVDEKFFLITISILASIGFILNLSLLAITFIKNKIKSVSDGLIAHLAIVDLMTSTSTLVYVYSAFNTLYWGWSYHSINLACKVTVFFTVVFRSISVATLLAICEERYQAVIHPTKPRLSAKQTVQRLLPMWVLVVIAPAINIPEIIADPYYKYICVTQIQKRHYVILINFIYFFICGYLLPAIYMIFCYTKIIRRLKQVTVMTSNLRTVQSGGERRKKMVIRSLIAVSAVFLISSTIMLSGLVMHIYIAAKSVILTKMDRIVLGGLTFYFFILLNLSPLYNPAIYLAKKYDWSKNPLFNCKLESLSASSTNGSHIQIIVKER